MFFLEKENIKIQKKSSLQDQFQFVHRCIASYCRRHLGIIEEPKLDLAPPVATADLPVGSSGSVRLIAPPTPTTGPSTDQTATIANYNQLHHHQSSSNHMDEDTSTEEAASVPDFPEEPPAPMGPEDLGSSAAF